MADARDMAIDAMAPLDAQQQRWVEQAMPRVTALAQALAARMPQIGFDELRSVGYEALVRAAVRYDPATGVPFGAFVHYRIRGAMIDAARRDNPTLRRHQRAVHALAASQALLEQADRSEPAGTQLDKRTLMERLSAAADLVAQTTTAVMLSRLGRLDPEDIAAPNETSHDAEQRLLDGELRDNLAAVVALCDRDERWLVDAIYVRGRTMHEIAAELEVSVSTVSRRHARVVHRLGEALRERLGR